MGVKFKKILAKQMFTGYPKSSKNAHGSLERVGT